jgi:transcription antitermination factor NusG
MPVKTADECPPVSCRHGRPFPSVPIVSSKRPKGVRRFLRDLDNPQQTERWYLALTRNQQERALAEELQSLRLSYVLPMQKTLVRTGRREVEGMKILFPNYVFVLCPATATYDVKATKRVAQLTPVLDEVQLEENLTDVLQLSKNGRFDPDAPKQYNFNTGQPVRIIDGPFSGLTGRFLLLEQGHGGLGLARIESPLLGLLVPFKVHHSCLVPLEPLRTEPEEHV